MSDVVYTSVEFRRLGAAAPIDVDRLRGQWRALGLPDGANAVIAFAHGDAPSIFFLDGEGLIKGVEWHLGRRRTDEDFIAMPETDEVEWSSVWVKASEVPDEECRSMGLHQIQERLRSFRGR